MKLEDISRRVFELVREASEAVKTGALQGWKLDLEEVATLRIQMSELSSENLGQAEEEQLNHRLMLLEIAAQNIRDMEY